MAERALRLYSGLFLTILWTLVGFETVKNLLRWLSGDLRTSISVGDVYVSVPLSIASGVGVILLSLGAYVIYWLTRPLLKAPKHFVAEPTFAEIAMRNTQPPEEFPQVFDQSIKDRFSDQSSRVVFDDTDGSWYFWEQDWAFLLGPYLSQEDAARSAKKYDDETL